MIIPCLLIDSIPWQDTSEYIRWQENLDFSEHCRVQTAESFRKEIKGKLICIESFRLLSPGTGSMAGAKEAEIAEALEGDLLETVKFL